MTNKIKNIRIVENRNPDAITGEPGSHPLGTGIGAIGVGGAATLVGAVSGGPVGAVIGAVIGAVAGGLSGKDVAEVANPTQIDSYWRENYSSRPYVNEDRDYEIYQPAYHYGYEQRRANRDRKFEEIEEIICENWVKSKGAEHLQWEEAREAIRDSYELDDGFYNIKANQDISPRKDNE